MMIQNQLKYHLNIYQATGKDFDRLVFIPK
jgi:hypothetical protein